MFTEEHKKAERRELLIHFIENHTEGNKMKEDLTLLSDVELKQRTQIIVKALKDNKDTTS
ncbi:MAG TPA: hypothetical protein VF411_03285 [Bacteroidia bacterium]